MTANGVLQIALYLGLLVLLAKPLGSFMARVYEGDPPRWIRFLRPLERGTYRVCRVRPDVEMTWSQYASAVLVFNIVGIAAVYVLQRVQSHLPWNPQGMPAVGPLLAFNTAVSFGTNTNWQSYGGETTLSYLTQMLGLTVQNFVSAAVGMAVLVALIRGLRGQSRKTIGNFWVDLTRGVLYILLPLAMILAFALVSQGVVQTLKPYMATATMERGATQAIAVGPAASQVAIKQLGTNGGGFFNANSAHPFENPTPVSNLIEVLAILLIPAGLCCTLGRMVGDIRQGWAIFAAMMLLFVAFLVVGVMAESTPTPILTQGGIDAVPGPLQAGGNMEGKETRFGIVNSGLWAAATTAASNGSVNAMHDSLTPLGGLAPMVLIQLGEVAFGGTGSGLYGMLVFALVAVFVSGLMVGRTPEYLGKKIESYEMKMASLVILICPILVLGGTAVAVGCAAGRNAVFNPGPHGFSEILYALSSAGNNNGSAFGGLATGVPFYHVLLGVAMFGARYWVIVPTLALAGSLAGKKRIPAGEGTLPTHGPTFVLLLVGIVLIVGALTFLPALALGPIVETLQAHP